VLDAWWLLVLLPAAAASGWLAAHGIERFRSRRDNYDLPSAYFKGLNFLLNEQPDKAIEVFIKMLEVDRDTVEMHLALGNLFGRRGEVERATRIHQNLIARPNLDKHQRTQALFQLGQDYFRAGLFDRAESLFLELADTDQHSRPALEHLLQIYEREKEWNQAISTARRLARVSGQSQKVVIAQYYCELAESAISDAQYDQARTLIARALDTDSRCARATIQLGRVEALNGNYRESIQIWRQLESQDPRYLGEVVDWIAGSYRTLGDQEGLREFLSFALERYGGIRLMLSLVDLAERQDGSARAERVLADWLRRFPSIAGLYRLIQLKLAQAESREMRDLELLKAMIGAIVENNPAYTCRRCGFSGRVLHWQCPGCKGWNTVEPADWSAPPAQQAVAERLTA